MAGDHLHLTMTTERRLLILCRTSQRSDWDVYHSLDTVADGAAKVNRAEPHQACLLRVANLIALGHVARGDSRFVLQHQNSQVVVFMSDCFRNPNHFAS